MMKRCAFQQNSVESMEYSVVCPKPRRLALFDSSFHETNHHFRPTSGCHLPEIGGDSSKPRADLLDMILTKGNCGERSCNQVPSSPPYFCGSPPSRASNPVIQDEHFGNVYVTPFSLAPLSPSPSPSSSSARGACVRMKFGHKPAAVRIEGFDCLSRDRRNCSISAVA